MSDTLAKVPAGATILGLGFDEIGAYVAVRLKNGEEQRLRRSQSAKHDCIMISIDAQRADYLPKVVKAGALTFDADGQVTVSDWTWDMNGEDFSPQRCLLAALEHIKNEVLRTVPDDAGWS